MATSIVWDKCHWYRSKEANQTLDDTENCLDCTTVCKQFPQQNPVGDLTCQNNDTSQSTAEGLLIKSVRVSPHVEFWLVTLPPHKVANYWFTIKQTIHDIFEDELFILSNPNGPDHVDPVKTSQHFSHSDNLDYHNFFKESPFSINLSWWDCKIKCLLKIVAKIKKDGGIGQPFIWNQEM